MKKILFTAIAAVSLFATAGVLPTIKSSAETEKLTESKAAYLCDAVSGTVAYEENATERLPIASMCKIMTLLLSFEAVDSGNLSYDEAITISDNASGMGGSQVFLETGLSYKAADLMKTIAVCSANDSCVAMAERIAGSESLFVEKMNDRARELGAENTLFANCTGLSKEPQYSCAKDVALMLRELLTHEKYFEFSRVWLEDFAHPDGRTTRITNTNRLLRFYDGCDGGKTGFTSQAGFCLAATAKRGDMRLVSVVIGAENSDKRFKSVQKLLDYAFANYENKIVARAGEPVDVKLQVRGGKQKEISVCPDKTLSLFRKKGENDDFTTEYRVADCVKAPVCAGAVVGEAVLYCGGVETQRCNLLAGETAERFSWKDAYRESARNFN